MNMALVDINKTPELKDILKNNLFHFLFFATSFMVISIIKGHAILPSSSDLIHYDAILYKSIGEEGFIGSGGHNAAFFPLFPYIWKLIGNHVYGIVIFNILIFYMALTVITKQLSFSFLSHLIFLSLPSMIFMYIPFSEAVFFVCSTVLLIGLHKHNLLLICVGIFLCSISRSVVAVFIPAFILLEFISGQKSNLKEGLKRTSLYILCSLAGISLVSVIQYQDTGEWFKFITIQSAWSHYFRMPNFPLSTWGGTRLVFIDGLALFLGCFAATYILFLMWQKLNGKAVNINRIVIFSLLYMAGVSMSVLFFQGGDLHSLNRYIFATAFFAVVLSELARSYSFKWRHLIYFFSTLTVFIFAMGINHHKHMLWPFIFFATTVLTHFFTKYSNKRVQFTAFMVVYAINTIFQAHLLTEWLVDQWIG